MQSLHRGFVAIIRQIIIATTVPPTTFSLREGKIVIPVCHLLSITFTNNRKGYNARMNRRIYIRTLVPPSVITEKRGVQKQQRLLEIGRNREESDPLPKRSSPLAQLGSG